MNCADCKRPINRGTELTKAIVVYLQADGSEKVYGWDRPDGKPPWLGGHPEGRLLRAYHYKHFRVGEKREKRGGDRVTGRGMGHIPTAYEITAMTANKDELALLGITEEEARAMSTQALTDRVVAHRRKAIEEGTGGDNWSFKEKMRAEEHGGPYDHHHSVRPDDFQTEAHLRYAHGIDPLSSANGRRQQHDEAHAVMERDRIAASRAQDPGYQQPRESDWRDQTQLEVSQVPQVGDPSDLHRIGE